MYFGKYGYMSVFSNMDLIHMAKFLKVFHKTEPSTLKCEQIFGDTELEKVVIFL